MEITNYCVIAGISLILLAGCLVHLAENDIFSQKRISKFRNLIYALMFEVTIDCLFEVLTLTKTPKGVLYAVKGGEMIVMPVLVYLVFDIFYDKRSMRQDEVMQKLGLTILATIVANAMVIIMLPVFSIDENRVYHRGPFVFMYIILLAVGLVSLIYGMVVFSNKTQSTMMQTMFAFSAILIVSIVLRAFFSEANYDFLCLSVAVPFLLIYYSHIVLRVDSLTRLLNRRVYSEAIKKINYTTIVIIIDANNFKKINDAHGHECGDRTLRQIGQAIYKIYGKIAYCYRVGGDEFCVILKPNVFERLIEETNHRDVYSLAEKLMGNLDELLRVKAETDENEGLLKYGVAQGYGVYYSQMSYPNIYDVIKLADKRMYYNKQKYKEAHPELMEDGQTEPNYFKGEENPENDRPKVIYEPSTVEVVEETEKATFIQHASSIENVEYAENVYIE